jgi:hypothetical protein
VFCFPLPLQGRFWSLLFSGLSFLSLSLQPSMLRLILAAACCHTDGTDEYSAAWQPGMALRRMHLVASSEAAVFGIFIVAFSDWSHSRSVLSLSSRAQSCPTKALQCTSCEQRLKTLAPPPSYSTRQLLPHPSPSPTSRSRACLTQCS